MTLKRPYKRTYRPKKNGGSAYINDIRFAVAPEQYVRSFLLIQEDFKKILEYIEPADPNECVYSFRLQELLMRICVDVEANFKAILNENGRKKAENMEHYFLVNKTHRLSDFEVKLPFWRGEKNIRCPFSEWRGGGANHYFGTKHITSQNIASRKILLKLI